MMNDASRTIRVAAALIVDNEGCLLLVRKAGTRWFMQAGGKIEQGEDSLATLRRELYEEIGVTFEPGDPTYLGCFDAPAANETGQIVKAELFHLILTEASMPAAEIEEAIWVRPDAAEGLPLAPLTRNHVLRLARAM